MVSDSRRMAANGGSGQGSRPSGRYGVPAGTPPYPGNRRDGRLLYRGIAADGKLGVL